MNKAKTKITEHPEWTLQLELDDHFDTFRSAGSETTYPRYSMRISASRNYSYFVVNVFGVVFLQVALGIGVYLFDAHEFEARFTNILTLFLTIVAFRIVLTDKLPKVSYLTVADVYILSAFGLYTFTAASDLLCLADISSLLCSRYEKRSMQTATCIAAHQCAPKQPPLGH
jgi:hypothetical protein